jgi:deoxyhypusine synthase
MPSRFEEFDCSRLRTHSVAGSARKVEIDSSASPWNPGGGARALVESLPDILAGRDLKAAVRAIAEAARAGRPVMLSMGAHVIKCGLSPIIADLINRGVITSLALNGAGAIHDTEIAILGMTSEDVVAGLKDGSFGMGAETAQFVNSAAREGTANGWGFGEAIGNALVASGAPHAELSLLATAAKAGIPATVHVAVGTDIVHMHASADGGAIGDCSMRDFRVFAACVEDLARQGGVLLNVGSAVVLPEVALKSFSMAANVGCSLDKVFAINLDFLRQYRAEQQIVIRVRALGGQAVSLTGHHEIMLPLIAAAVVESMEENVGG